MSPLLSASELGAIQAIGITGMITPVTIFPESGELGLELTDDPYGSSAEISPTGTTVNGWLVGRWQNDRDSGFGDIDTTTIYRLRLPVGTAIGPGYDVEIGGHRYHVVDTGNDQTWPEWLNCSLLRNK